VAAVQPLGQVGTTVKTVGMCGLAVLGIINKLANNRSDITFQGPHNADTPHVLGSSVSRIVGERVDLTLMYNEAMDSRPADMIVFKPDELKVIEHTGLESLDVQVPGENAMSHKMQHRLGLKILNPRTAMLLKNLAA